MDIIDFSLNKKMMETLIRLCLSGEVLSHKIEV